MQVPIPDEAELASLACDVNELGDHLGQIPREAVCIVERKRVAAREGRLVGSSELFEMSREHAQAGVEGARFRVHAPLIRLSKAGIIHEGLRLGVDYANTVSCYAADEDGRACGLCDACRLRAQGFHDAGVADPTRYAPSLAGGGQTD